MYVATVVSKQLHRVTELLAYQMLIVQEAHHCSSRGWLAYDSFFCQQTVGNEAAHWFRLYQSLYTVTIVAKGSRETDKSCVESLDSDHGEEQCTL